MSEKLIVRNFGPIESVELNLKKITVFTGEQSSGKSTLAKLISIFRQAIFILNVKDYDVFFSQYGIGGYFTLDTFLSYQSPSYCFEYKDSSLSGRINKSIANAIIKALFPNSDNSYLSFVDEDETTVDIQKFALFFHSHAVINSEQSQESNKEVLNSYISSFDIIKAKLQSVIKQSNYIPAERAFLSSISGSLFGLNMNKISLPYSLLAFGNLFEYSRKNLSECDIKFLSVRYNHSDGLDFVIDINGKKHKLNESASGYQAIVPTILMVEARLNEMKRHKIYNPNTNIIEEPELNLFPKAQKDFVYYLAKNCTLQEDELVITTHSPYVLSSLNNLLLAGKLKSENPDLINELGEILPVESAIAPNDFAAYFLSNGGAKSILDEKTGLIGENDLDGISEEIGDEFDSLLDLIKI